MNKSSQQYSIEIKKRTTSLRVDLNVTGFAASSVFQNPHVVGTPPVSLITKVFEITLNSNNSAEFSSQYCEHHN